MGRNVRRGFLGIGDDGYVSITFLPTAVQNGLVTYTDGKIDLSLIPVGGAGGIVTYDENGKITFTDLPDTVQDGLVTYTDGKITFTLLPTTVQNGLVTYTDGKIDFNLIPTGGTSGLVCYVDGKIAMIDLHTNEANGVTALDSASKVAESLLYDYMVCRIGAGILYYGSDVPTNYLLCNGSWISATTYSSLFPVIGYRYDVASNSYNSYIKVETTEMDGWAQGIAIRFSVAPNSLSTTTTYYYGPEVDSYGTTCVTLHSTYADAMAGTNAIDCGHNINCKVHKYDYFKLPTVSDTYVRYA